MRRISIFVMLMLWCHAALAIELPPQIINTNGAKILLILDDSHSMNEVWQHPYFVENQYLPDDKLRWDDHWTNNWPNMYYKVESGRNSPSPTSQLRLMWWTEDTRNQWGYFTFRQGIFTPNPNDPEVARMEWQYVQVNNEHRANPSAPFIFNSLPVNNFINQLTCGSGDYKECRARPLDYNSSKHWSRPRLFHRALPIDGVNTIQSYRNPDYYGAAVVSTDILERVNNNSTGSFETDSEGNEYLALEVTGNQKNTNGGCDGDNLRGLIGDKLASLSDTQHVYEASALEGQDSDIEGTPTAIATATATPTSTTNSSTPKCEVTNPPQHSGFRSWGGRVKFQGKEFVLGNGFYRPDYFNWILRYATPEQLATLPAVTRLDVAKDAVKRLILAYPDIEMAVETYHRYIYARYRTDGNIFEYYESNGPLEHRIIPPTGIRIPFKTPVDKMMRDIDEIASFRRQTPTSETLIRSANYMMYGNSGNGSDSPVDEACISYNIFLISDGYPEDDKPQRLFGNWVTDFDQDQTEYLPSNEDCNIDRFAKPDQITGKQPVSSKWAKYCSQFTNDVAFQIHNVTDFNPNLEGRQYIKTAAIAMERPLPYLDGIAAAGGFGASKTAAKTDELFEILSAYANSVVVSPVAGGAFALSEYLGTKSRIYRPVFRGDRWTGNIDVFEADNDSKSLKFAFDIAGDRKTRTEDLNLFTSIKQYFWSSTNTLVELSTANANLLKPHLFANFTDDQDPLLPIPIRGFNSGDGAARNLISYLRGNDIPYMRSRDRDGDGGYADYGDIVYSPVVELGNQAGNLNRFSGYSEYIRGIKETEKNLIMFGSNDGIFNAVDADNGHHMWGYVPNEILSEVHILGRPDYGTQHRRSFVDGEISVHDVYVNDSWRTYVAFGLRNGGYSYVILDVTDRDMPKLVREFKMPNILGTSWSKPSFIYVKKNGSRDIPGKFGANADPSQYDWYIAFGSGESIDNTNTFLVFFHLNSRQFFFKTIETNVEKSTRLSHLTVTQSDIDVSLDRIYFGSESGDLYRIEIEPGQTPDRWDLDKVYDGDASHPIVIKPKTLQVENLSIGDVDSNEQNLYKTAVGVYFGTGRYDNFLDNTLISDTRTQGIIGIFDPVNIQDDTLKYAVKGLIRSDLVLQKPSTGNVTYDVDGEIYKLPRGSKGFYLELHNAIELKGDFIEPAGMATSNPLDFRGVLLFPTFMPMSGSENSCRFGGYSLLTAINIRNGLGAMIDRNITSSDLKVNGGLTDLNDDGVLTRDDLDFGFAGGLYEAITDANITSIDLGSHIPHRHDGSLSISDIRLGSDNKVLFPAVSSLGYSGLTSGLAIIPSLSQIVVQTSFGDRDPTVGNPEAGTNNPTTPGNNDSSDTPKAPQSLPINIFTKPAEFISHHEVIK